MSLYANLIVSVLRYEQIKTTEARAKEVRGQVEKVITLAKDGTLASRRRIIAQLPNEPLVIDKLINEIAPKYADRSSGYTRITSSASVPGMRRPWFSSSWSDIAREAEASRHQAGCSCGPRSGGRKADRGVK